jgi:RNA methyltransferase, TrmH family
MKLSELHKLQQKKYRTEYGRYLVEGEHLILELQKAAARQPALRDSELFVTERYKRWQSPFAMQLISESQLARLTDTQSPQGIVASVPIVPPPPASAAEKAIYLYQIQDPGNLGAILRTLSWFGQLRCVLSPDSVDPYNSKAVRASMGAIFHVPVETDLPVQQVSQRYQRLAALQMSGEPISAAAFRGFDCYVFGNEARGLPPAEVAALGASPFTIPGAVTSAGGPAIDSLNLAAAVTLSVYELSR